MTASCMSEVNTLDAAPPRRLGHVHGHVGVAEQIFRGGRRRRRGDADAAEAPHHAAPHEQRHREGGEDPSATATPASPSGRRWRTMANSSPPRRTTRSRGAGGSRRAGRHGHQDLVAEVVAGGVVDGLELVEVEQEEADGGAARSEQAVELLVQQGPVGEAGEVVVEGLVPEPVLELDASATSRSGEHDALYGGVATARAVTLTSMWRHVPSLCAQADT